MTPALTDAALHWMRTVAASIRRDAAGRTCGTCTGYVAQAGRCRVHESLASGGRLRVVSGEAPACSDWKGGGA